MMTLLDKEERSALIPTPRSNKMVEQARGLLQVFLGFVF